MSRTITAAERGKSVVNGEIVVGRIANVLSGTAFVELDPDLADVTVEKLGWTESGRGSVPIPETAVERITEDEVRLISWSSTPI